MGTGVPGGPYYIETYHIWFLHDRDLRQERVEDFRNHDINDKLGDSLLFYGKLKFIIPAV